VPVIQKEGRCVCVLIDLGPYNRREHPIRFKLGINSSDGTVVDVRIVEKYYSDYGDIGDNTSPIWRILRLKPSLKDYQNARNTLRNALNGAYGKIDEEMIKFLTSIYGQIFYS
jgi:hypothetical protein